MKYLQLSLTCETDYDFKLKYKLPDTDSYEIKCEQDKIVMVFNFYYNESKISIFDKILIFIKNLEIISNKDFLIETFLNWKKNFIYLLKENELKSCNEVFGGKQSL